MLSRRSAVFVAIAIVLIFALYRNPDLIPETAFRSGFSLSHEDAKPKGAPTSSSGSLQTDTSVKDSSGSGLSPQVLNYFDQVFSAEKPAAYDFPALRQHCEQTKWLEDEVYLQCGGMAAGMTSIMSQIKTCFKMAVDAGVGIVLPSMPLRDSKNLGEFNFMNHKAYLTYDKWFDADHLIESVGRACPRMKIIHPVDLDTSVPVKNQWDMDLANAPAYHAFESYFWTGRPFKPFFDEQYKVLEKHALEDPARIDSQKGVTVISIVSQFLLFRITDDPTKQDMQLWTDLSHLIRFKEEPRSVVSELLSELKRPFYGVHFRVEADTIWSSLDHQLSVDLDALDTAWAKYGKPDEQKPLVYLACGDQEQVQKFVTAAKDRDWEVTHKWQLAQSNKETLKKIDDLAFDFQGAVDMGIMIQSDFFLGITGSAFSSTIANARDITGRYRGSSFVVYDDGNARTHLFNDGDAAAYACCL